MPQRVATGALGELRLTDRPRHRRLYGTRVQMMAVQLPSPAARKLRAFKKADWVVTRDVTAPIAPEWNAFGRDIGHSPPVTYAATVHIPDG